LAEGRFPGSVWRERYNYSRVAEAATKVADLFCLTPEGFVLPHAGGLVNRFPLLLAASGYASFLVVALPKRKTGSRFCWQRSGIH